VATVSIPTEATLGGPGDDLAGVSGEVGIRAAFLKYLQATPPAEKAIFIKELSLALEDAAPEAPAAEVPPALKDAVPEAPAAKVRLATEESVKALSSRMNVFMWAIGLFVAIFIAMAIINDTNSSSRIGGLEAKVDTRIGGLEARIGGLEARVDSRIGGLEARMDNLYSIVMKLQEDFVKMQASLDGMQASLNRLLASSEERRQPPPSE
jgi:hypothetical protein